MSTAWILVAASLFNVLLVGVLFWKFPDWSRPELLFGVTVPAESRRGAAGRAVIDGFRRRVLGVTAVSCLASWLPLLVGERIAAGAGFVGLVIVGQIVALFWAFLRARRAALPLAASPSGKRVALVDSGHDSMPGGWFWQSGPFVLFAGMVAVLAWWWPEIPDRFVTHWNGSFEPDGWSDKSLVSVFGMAAMGLAVIATLPPVAWSLLHLTRRVHVEGEAGRAESARRRAVAVLLLWLEYVIVATFAPLMLVPFLQTPTAAKGLTLSVMIMAFLAPIAMFVVWFVKYGSVITTTTRTAEASVDGAPIGDRTADRFWKWGVIYYNPDDPVLWVEKRFGVGYTFNMARPSAWWILGGMIGLPLVMAIAVAVAA